jgi:hypothetical protein
MKYRFARSDKPENPGKAREASYRRPLAATLKSFLFFNVLGTPGRISSCARRLD